MKLAYLVIALAVLSLLTACYAPIDNTPPPLPDETTPTQPNTTGVDDIFSDEGDIAPPPIPE
ncbi:MAG: hypothetical protein ABIJ21_09325 [Nanoarchaeota archaeon]